MRIFPHKEFKLVTDKTMDEVETLLKAEIINYNSGKDKTFTESINLKGKIEYDEFYIVPRRIRMREALSKPIAKGVIFGEADNTILQGTIKLSILSKFIIGSFVLCVILFVIMSPEFEHIMIYSLIFPMISLFIGTIQAYLDFKKHSNWLLDTLKLTVWAQESEDY